MRKKAVSLAFVGIALLILALIVPIKKSVYSLDYFALCKDEQYTDLQEVVNEYIETDIDSLIVDKVYVLHNKYIYGKEVKHYFIPYVAYRMDNVYKAGASSWDFQLRFLMFTSKKDLLVQIPMVYPKDSELQIIADSNTSIRERTAVRNFLKLKIDKSSYNKTDGYFLSVLVATEDSSKAQNAEGLATIIWKGTANCLWNFEVPFELSGTMRYINNLQ